MNCTHAREELAGLDRNEVPGPELTAHLRECPTCRELAERVRAVEATLRSSHVGFGTMAANQTTEPEAARFTARVMAAVARDQESLMPSAQAPAFGSWSAVGALIVGGLVVIQFSTVVEWLRIEIGSVIDVALGTLFGVALTIYIMFLVGSNLPSIQRLFRLRSR